ncbi:carbon-monoxide dehydrogenase catalytic subunit [Desulfitispora alkaliphila]|uniref:anaerobic carbon-monoxide dehydrogenase catalytic subunit n=1 Tax=Desulfitispora alkaliphila TaxID=622674 RepID=UPI003D20C415
MPRFRDVSHTSKPSDAPRVPDRKLRERTVDPAALEVLKKAKDLNLNTAFDRAVAQQPHCKFGYEGICCRVCAMGPCRIKDGDGPDSKGICGANAYTIVARNIVRLVASGTSAHSEHGKHLAKVLLHTTDGGAPDYKITDPDKLKHVAKSIGIEVEGKSDEELAKEVATEALNDFGRQDDKPITWINSFLTEGRKKKFIATDIMPSSIDGTVTSLLGQTHIGVDADPVNIIFGGLKTALADINGCSLATDCTDVLFGTPKPVVTEANLGVLEKDQVNVIVHGHNPLLSQMVVQAARDLESEAKQAGATGIGISGICCTGNEVLMREGVPLATSFASQELAIMTGAVDTMVVDVQCIMPGLRAASECFDTKLVTTMPTSKIPGSYHYAFDEKNAVESAKAIVRLAIDTFKERKGKEVDIPQIKNKVTAGFSLEAMKEIFGYINPDNPIKVLADALESGEIKGIAYLIGCNNLKGIQDDNHLKIAKELVANDIFVICGGCAAQAYAKEGLLTSEAVDQYAGEGLKAFINKLNDAAGDKLKEKLPLMFHTGSCVDYSRGARLANELANEMNIDVPKLPFAVSAPEAMSEKAVAIGCYWLALGVPVHVGVLPPIEGSKLVYGVATQIASDVFGGYFMFETDGAVAATKLLSSLEYRAWKLRVHKEAKEKYETDLCQGY